MSKNSSDVASDGKLPDLMYADDVVLWVEDPVHLKMLLYDIND